MENKFKKPKNKNNSLMTNEVEYILIGLMLLLISIIGLLNKGPVGNFLTYIGVYLFGAFYFIIFLFLIVVSVYMMIKKKGLRIRLNMVLLGFVLVYLATIIASSTSNSEIRFNNLIEVYNEHIAVVSSKLFVVDSISNLSVVGGGFIGYSLKALLNTCITNVGTNIVVIVFMIVGLILTLKDAIIYIVKFFASLIKKGKEKKKNKMNEEDNKPKIDENENSDIPPYIERKPHEVFVTPLAPIKDEIVNEPHSDLVDTPISNSYFDEIEDKEEDNINDYKTETNIEELDVPVREETNIRDYFADNIDEENNDINLGNNKSEEKSVQPLQEEIPSKEISVANDYFTPNSQDNTIEVPHEELKKEDTIVLQQNKEESKKEINKQVKKKFVLPSSDLLKYHAHEDTRILNENEAALKVDKINRTFLQYKIGAQVISYTIGPSVTRFNIKMNEGVRVNTLASITNEISIALNGDKSVRLELIVEGRDTSSIEVGNKKATPVSFKECFDAIKDRTSEKDKLLIPLGKDIENQVVTTYMNELPHLLVAGTTGSGKSVFVNSIISTFIMRNTPEELKLVLVDPKKVEFKPFSNIPHLLCPIITEASEASALLKKLCDEMDDRYEQMSLRSVSKISDYNELAEARGFPKLPSIVLIIDEYADLITKNAKEIEGNVQRICQKARAAGIYLILCTQRPSVNVVTGDIKAVIPSRIALLVPQANDSKVILDQTGAESLLGYGDMLCQIPKRNGLVRVQSPLITGVEIADICDYLRAQQEVEYDSRFCNLVQKVESNQIFGERTMELDELYEEAKEHVLKTRIASTSNLQSYFRIGFARADAILYSLEQNGVVKRVNGNRRIVVGPSEESDEE